MFVSVFPALGLQVWATKACSLYVGSRNWTHACKGSTLLTEPSQIPVLCSVLWNISFLGKKEGHLLILLLCLGRSHVSWHEEPAAASLLVRGWQTTHWRLTSLKTERVWDTEAGAELPSQPSLQPLSADLFCDILNMLSSKSLSARFFCIHS